MVNSASIVSATTTSEALQPSLGEYSKPRWTKYLRRCASDPVATVFLNDLELQGLSFNTILAYGRSVECLIELQGSLAALQLTTSCVHAFVRHLFQTPSRHPGANGSMLSRATVRQRVVGLRAFAGYLVDIGRLKRNPVPRGRIHRSVTGEVIPVRRGLVPMRKDYPRLPSDEEWTRLLTAFQQRSARDRLMFMLAYDGALRRTELVSLRLNDFDFSARHLIIRPEHSKGGCGRSVVYSAATSAVLGIYLQKRRKLTPTSPHLFLSESPRNKGKPVGPYTWALLAASIGRQANVTNFSTHTLRHLRLTDLARAGMDIKEIAQFAGHRSLDSTLLYIHLSGRDLAHAFQRASMRLKDRFGSLGSEP